MKNYLNAQKIDFLWINLLFREHFRFSIFFFCFFYILCSCLLSHNAFIHLSRYNVFVFLIFILDGRKIERNPNTMTWKVKEKTKATKSVGQSTGATGMNRKKKWIIYSKVFNWREFPTKFALLWKTENRIEATKTYVTACTYAIAWLKPEIEMVTLEQTKEK